MKKFISYLWILSFFFPIYSEEKIYVETLNFKKLPKNILYSGKIVSAKKWKDIQGEHILLLTETGILYNKEDESNSSGELYAFHYLETKGKYEQTWKIYDFVKQCPVDIEVKFLNDFLKVSDLNHDGITEIWVPYVTACKGDVSPSTLKIIGYEAKKKFAVRGQTKVYISETELVGGDFVFDKSLQESPSSFHDFAKKLWEELILKSLNNE